MKVFLTALSLSLASLAPAQDKTPAIFNGYLTLDTAVKGEIVAVVPPEEIEKYIQKVDKVRVSDPEWFREYSEKALPGIPLPYHEKLGLSKEEYEEYLSSGTNGK